MDGPIDAPKKGKKREPFKTALLIPKMKNALSKATLAQQVIFEYAHIVANSTQFGIPVKSWADSLVILQPIV
jgi:hypothetical protein